MTDQFKYVQAQNFSLSGGGAVAGATTIVLKSFTQIDGTLLTMTDFGDIGFGTLEPGNGTLEEQIAFTGVTQNTNGTATLTGVSTVLMVSPYTNTSGLAQTHAGSTTFVISNTSGFYDQLTAKDDDETINGTYTFTNPRYPRMDTSTPFPVDNEQLATKAYADSLTFAGAPNASTTVKGIVQLPTQAQVDAKTATGSTGAALSLIPATQRSTLLSDYVADTGAADAYVITPAPAITTYATGQRFSFRVANTNATTTPTIAVNGLSGTAIFVRGGSAPAAGDIKAGMIIEVEKALNGFEMMVPVGNAPATSAQVSALTRFGGTGADGALTITAGATNIDLGSAAIVVKNYTTISITGTGSLTFTNPATNGTVVILKATGNVTLTSSTAPMIVASSLGGAGGAGGASSNNAGTAGSAGKNAFRIMYGGNAGAGGAAATGGSATTTQGSVILGQQTVNSKAVRIFTGSGGAGGGSGTASGGTGGAGGAGARGGGALYIECAGAFNFTTSAGISVAGATGTAGSAGVTSNAGGGGGGGGGAGGSAVIIYNTLTAASGTITVTAGAGGAGAAGAAGGTPGAGGAAGNGSSGTGIGAAGGLGGDAGGGSKGAGGGSGGGSDDGLSNGSVGGDGQGGTAAAAGGGGGASGYSLMTLNTEFT